MTDIRVLVPNVCTAYPKNFGLDSTAVMFDGYPDKPSTKDYAHLKCSKGVTGPKVHFKEDMACTSKKHLFLSKKSNEQNFINLLAINLQASGCTVIHAEELGCWSAHCWNCSGVTVQPPHDCYSWWHRCIDSAHTLCTNFISGSVLAELRKDDFQEAWICFEHLTSMKGPWRRCLQAHSLRPCSLRMWYNIRNLWAWQSNGTVESETVRV